MQNIFRVVLGTALILLIPLVAMLFTDEVTWDATDFIVMGGLLLGTGFIYVFVAQRITNTKNRLIFGAVLLFVFLLIWADLAVGIFNIPGFSGS